MGTTRLSREERNSITGMACARYRNAAMKLQKRRPLSSEGPACPIHAPFEGTYAERFVRERCIIELGLERTERLTYENFRSLVEDAQARHRELVALGAVTTRGLPLDQETGLATVQPDGFDPAMLENQEGERHGHAG